MLHLYYYCIMQLEGLKDILSTYELRSTSCRYDVLDFFIDSEFALELKDLESALPKYDRVTLYRTINTFIDKGIIHKIPSDSGIARYALTENKNNEAQDHIHFKCEVCGKTECLPNYAVPSVRMPKGYRLKSVNMIVNGVCNQCAAKG